ncbi:putative toxin [Demequina rhizosphaerae]|uniref:putative toxin n=1 Tax=Demequina rhizosphaerae TaxID=1638985 RepID=UPI00147060AF|nr:putative toxin [Demequina rhizosphaerae]
MTTNTLTGPVQIALEAPGITIHSQSTWTKSSGQVIVNGAYNAFMFPEDPQPIVGDYESQRGWSHFGSSLGIAGMIPGGLEALGAKTLIAVGERVVTRVAARETAQVAANGGAASVRLGQAGENAVRGAFDIGPKATAQIGGRTRIFDGLNDVAVSEVKNVKYQAYTQQLKDSLAYAQQNGLRFDLYVRGGANPTTLSGPLEAAIRNGDIGLRYIP